MPPQPPKSKGLHPLAITGIVVGSLLVLCCIGGGAFVLLSGEDEEPAAQEEPAPGQPADGDDAVPGVGDPARDGKFEFVVTEIETGIASVGDDILGKEAQGQSCWCTCRLRISATRPSCSTAPPKYLFDAEGWEHSSDGEAAFYVENSDSFLNEINPGNRVEGIVVFDIPADAVPAMLRLPDSPLSGGVEVDLN